MTADTQERGLTVEDQIFMAKCLGIDLDTTTEETRLAAATQIVSAMRWLISDRSLEVGEGEERREVTLASLSREMIDADYGRGFIGQDQAGLSQEAEAAGLAASLQRFFIADLARAMMWETLREGSR